MNAKESLFLPPSGSTIAGDVDALFYFILITGTIIFLLVIAGLVYFSAKYRRRNHEAPLTSGVDNNFKLEVLWTAIPTLLVLILFFWSFKTYMKMRITPKDAIEIKVTAKKWMWIFDYPNGANTLNELIVPEGKPVKLLMSSEDVIHSFFVPAFRVKMDVLPNRYTVAWFEATNNGNYTLTCAEYCGTGHSEMLGTVSVLPENDYEAWLASSERVVDTSIPLHELGRQLFTAKACNACHMTDGTVKIGPALNGIFNHEVELSDGKKVVVDENYLRRSILEPQADIVQGFPPTMPTYQGLIKDRELDALVAYIKSLTETND
ncbi:MAG: cytochrome c oxidase subunit II [Fidelibacterota bacterium]